MSPMAGRARKVSVQRNQMYMTSSHSGCKSLQNRKFFVQVYKLSGGRGNGLINFRLQKKNNVYIYIQIKINPRGPKDIAY